MSARINNYVKANEHLVNGWLISFVHKYLIYEMTNDRRVASGDRVPTPIRIRMSELESNGNRQNICKDILVTHFGIATSHTIRVYLHGCSYEFAPVRSALYEYMKDKGSKPNLKPDDNGNLLVDDLYFPLEKISLGGIIYIYEHQEEYEFKYLSNRHTGARYMMCVLEKELVDSSNYIALKNAIGSYYANKTGDVCETVFGFSAPHLNLRTSFDPDGNLFNYEFKGIIKGMTPSGLAGLNSEDIQEKIDLAARRVAYMTETLDELRRLQASILEAEAAGGIQDLYFSKLIARFKTIAPLLINSEDESELNIVKMILRDNNI